MKYVTLAALVAAFAFATLPSQAASPAKTTAKSKHAVKAAKTVKPVAATKYECVKCHMQYSAADAKKANFVDPMDGGKLVPLVTAGKK
jgi:hypothetical protein